MGDELGHRLGWDRWMHHHHNGLAGDGRNRSDVTDEIVFKIVIERRVDRATLSEKEQRIAVRRGTHDRLGGDSGARTRAVLDNEGLAKTIRQPLTHRACHDVRWSACRKWHDPAHRPRRIIERQRDARHDRECGSACRQMQKISAGKFHDATLHSALMLRARMTLLHFSVSSAMSLPKSAGEPASALPPDSAIRALIVGSARAVLVSW